MAQRKFTYDRFFGDNIDYRIRHKLEARQRLQKSGAFGHTIDAGTPYTDDFNTPSGPDLSQRIPWARMWTAVETYELTPKYEDLVELARDPAEMSKWNYETKTTNVKIFSVGNQAFRDYEENGSTGSVVGGLLQNNQFLKPNAGITSIETSTSGYMGAVTETIVNFKIFNYADWENVFVPYFMVPGATVFIDWGWNTSDIYNPVELMEGLDEQNTGAVKGDFGFKSFREKMWGSGAHGGDTGLIWASEGDLNVERGRVTKFNSTVDSDGSFNCFITVVSENYALIDYDQSTGISFPTIFEDEIALQLARRVEKEYGINIQETTDSENKSTTIASDKVKRLLPLYVGPNSQLSFMGEDGPKFVEISDKALEAGIFYRPLDEVVVDEINKSVSGLSTSNQTYVTFKKFGELLNFAIGIDLSGKKSEDKISYDMEFGEVTFNPQLYARQVFQNKLSKQLTFMYPTKITQRSFEEEEVNYGPVDQVGPNFVQYTEQTEDIILNTSENMAKVKSVPIGQMWINLPLIYKAFKKHTSVKAAVEMIFDEINKDSLGIFNLRLKDRGPNQLSTTDSNFTTPSSKKVNDNSGGGTTESTDPNNPTDDIDDIFTFSVFSPNTIVNSMDLQMTMENNALANKIAIQGMNAGSLVYPLSNQLKKDLAVRDINIASDNNNLFVRHIPTQDQDADVKFMKNTLADSKSKEDKELAILAKQQAKEVETNNLGLLFDIPDSPWKQVGVKTRSEKAVAPVEYERENKENPKLDDPDPAGDFPEDLYVGSISNYFNLKMLGKSIDQQKFQDIIMPYNVTLSIYGIQGIYPGNKFEIDYLPAKYRKKTYFVVMKINQSLTQQGWITTITGQMRFKGEEPLDNTILYNPKVHVSKKKLWNMGYTEEQIEELRENGKQFWTVVPKFANKVSSCLDPLAMNYKNNDSKFKWDCSGIRNGDDLKCCKYCPDGRTGAHEDGWALSDNRQLCENAYGKQILNPYLEWEDAPAGFEWQPGSGWVATDKIDGAADGSTANTNTVIPNQDNGICKDKMATNYGYTSDWRYAPHTDGINGPECEVDGAVNSGLKPKCCIYMTPEEMDDQYKSNFATKQDGTKCSPWNQNPRIYYWGYSGGWKSTWGGNNYQNGKGGVHCGNYDSGCDYCCAYGHCACNGFEGTNTAPGMSCSDYLWQGGSKDRTKYVSSWSTLLTSTKPRGIKKSYAESNAGKILDIVESVSYCYDTAQKNDFMGESFGECNSEYRWRMAQYRACCSNNSKCPEYDTWSKIHNVSLTSQNGNYMTVFKKKAGTSSLPADISVIVKWAEEDGDAPNGNGWGQCFLNSDWGNSNDRANKNAQDAKWNFGGDCWNNGNSYPCPDESCCNW